MTKLGREMSRGDPDMTQFEPPIVAGKQESVQCGPHIVPSFVTGSDWVWVRFGHGLHCLFE